MNHKRQGFTIIELLIIIVVVVVLAAISMGIYSNFQNRARASVTEADQLGRMLGCTKGSIYLYQKNGAAKLRETYEA